MRISLIKSIISFIIISVILQTRLFGGQIVYPWRAAKAIVKEGSNFKILYNNINYLPVDSVILEGPYNKVILHIDTLISERLEYDNFTHASVNNQIWVSVPSGTPEELYDLVIKSGGETHLSQRSVKVVREFKQKHCFIHISDLHISRQWVGTPVSGYAKELELFDSFIEVANIISPDFVIITGDLIHDYTRINADSTGWGGITLTDAYERPLLEEKWKNCFNGSSGFSGLNGLNSPVFLVTGNHDYYGLNVDDYNKKAGQWNELCGLRVYGFSYGETRVVAIDNFLGDPLTDIPDKYLMSGLQEKTISSFFESAGSGQIRIMAQHIHDRVDTAFINQNKINILLHGHNHKPFQEFFGSTPTLSSRPGVVCRSGVKDIDGELGYFRIFFIDGDSYTYTSPIRFCKDPRKQKFELELNLSLIYDNANDGTFDKNTAIIKNFLPLDLENCKIRFVMKKGDYKVSSGLISQTINTDTLSVVDVYTNVQQDKIKIVKIFPVN